MRDLYMLDAVQLDGSPRFPGEVVNVSDDDARCAVAGNHARYATDDDIANCTNPRPAAELREGMIGMAVPGGKRPWRR